MRIFKTKNQTRKLSDDKDIQDLELNKKIQESGTHIHSNNLMSIDIQDTIV